MHRRRYLSLGGSCLVMAVAGCSGDGESDNGESDNGSSGGSGTPEPDVSPEELLPDVSDGWAEESSGEIQITDEAEAGAFGTYTGPDGDEYRIEILRFGSEDEATSFADTEYQHWSHYAVLGNFYFGCRYELGNDTSEKCVDLLTNAAHVTGADISPVGE